MNIKIKKGDFLIFTVGILWGSIGLFIQLLVRAGSSAPLSSFLRMFFAFLILAIFTITKHGISAFIVTKRTLMYSAVLGIVCHGIYNVFYVWSVMISGITVSAVLLNIAPVFTAIF